MITILVENPHSLNSVISVYLPEYRGGNNIILTFKSIPNHRYYLKEDKNNYGIYCGETSKFSETAHNTYCVFVAPYSGTIVEFRYKLISNKDNITINLTKSEAEKLSVLLDRVNDSSISTEEDTELIDNIKSIIINQQYVKD